MNTTLSPILVQRFCALQAELIPEVVTEMDGLAPKLEQIIRVLEWSRIENLLQTWVSAGPGQPQIDRCALGQCLHSQGGAGLENHPRPDRTLASGQATQAHL